jgi:GTP-binding protein HflX
VVALVGYTNAGKSTLLNALTGADVLAEDRLFATLDPTTRRLRLPDGRTVLVAIIGLSPTAADTGRSQRHWKIREADLLVHVIDITNEYSVEQAETVDRVLEELDLGDKPRLLVLNKADALPGWPEDPVVPAGALDGVLISAERRWGLERLMRAIEGRLAETWPELTWRLPYAEAQLLPLLHRQGKVTSERYDPKGIVLRGRMPPSLQSALAPFRTKRGIVST